MRFTVLPVVLFAAFSSAQPGVKPPPEARPAEPQKPEAKPAEKAKEPVKESPPAKDVKPADPYILGHTVKDIDGKEQKLEQYKGKVILIINVASNCGNTPQYAGLEKLYQEKKDQGLVILAFPSNDFAGQEPGSDADIKKFCREGKYHVTFPLFSKISVKGAEQHELFKHITSLPKPAGEEPGWNFTKYLVDREGRLVARFEPRTSPTDDAMVKKIEELLGAKGKEGAKPEAPKGEAPKPESAKPAEGSKPSEGAK